MKKAINIMSKRDRNTQIKRMALNSHQCLIEREYFHAASQYAFFPHMMEEHRKNCRSKSIWNGME